MRPAPVRRCLVRPAPGRPMFSVTSAGAPVFSATSAGAPVVVAAGQGGADGREDGVDGDPWRDGLSGNTGGVSGVETLEG